MFLASECYLNAWKEKETIVKKTVIFLVTIGLLLGIFEITTATANKPSARLVLGSIGLPSPLELQGVEVSDRIARSYDIPQKDEPYAEVRQTKAYTPGVGKGALVSAPYIKETILGCSADVDADSDNGITFIHAEGIAQMLPEKYTVDEKDMIAYVVYAEARGESFEGMVAVAQVIINRYESGKFGDSIKSVVYSRHQFAVSKRYNDLCMAAVEYAIDNTPYPKNMYYFQKSKRKEWYGIYFDRIGNHSFYCGKW